MNGDASALAASSAATSAISRSPSAVTPPPSTTDVDVGGQHEHAHGRRDAAGEADAQFARERVARVGGVEDVAHGERAGAAPALGDGAAAGERFDAAVLAAAAQRAVRVDRDVADLARRAARTAPQLAVGDDAGRDAGAEVEVGHRPRSGAPTDRSA